LDKGPQTRTSDEAWGRLERLLHVFNRLAASRLVRTLLPLAILSAAAYLIRKEVQEVSLAQLLGALGSTPLWAIGLAVLFTLIYGACLAVLEWYALGFIGMRLPRWRVALASAGTTAMSNAMGFGLASGTAVRLRLYAFAGLTATDVAKLTLLLSAALFVSGIVTLGGSVLLDLGAVNRQLRWPVWAVAGAGVASLIPGLVWILVLRRFAREHRPNALTRTGRISVLLAAIGSWVSQAAALFVLSAGPVARFPHLLAASCFGALIGSTVGVPADLGVLDAAVLGSGAMGPAHQGAAALIMFRLIFQLAPLMIATTVMSGRQVLRLLRPKR
jgi:phosphatidylglycerol lysyltransferase